EGLAGEGPAPPVAGLRPSLELDQRPSPVALVERRHQRSPEPRPPLPPASLDGPRGRLAAGQEGRRRAASHPADGGLPAPEAVSSGASRERLIRHVPPKASSHS